MSTQDHVVLEELLDAVEQLGQRSGSNLGRNQVSSSRTLHKDVRDYADACRRGELKGRARKRKSHQLFQTIIALYPEQ